MSLFLHQIRRSVAFHHLLSNGSSAVNGCRQNESPNSWWKHHNNPQVLPHHSSPSVNILWSEKLCACKKTNQSLRYFNIKPVLLASPLSIILFFFSMKKLSHLSQERNIYRSSTACKSKKPKTALNICWWISMCEESEDQKEMDLFHWRNHYVIWTYIFARINSKNLFMMDLFLTSTKLFISKDVNWWTGVVWITCGLL